jgi:hypothetical protein
MSELAVVEKGVDPFDTVTLNPEGRVDYTDGRLTALYPADSETEDYRVALFHYDGADGSVELPEGAVVLDAGEGVVTALVPEGAYSTEGGA